MDDRHRGRCSAGVRRVRDASRAHVDCGGRVQQYCLGRNRLGVRGHGRGHGSIVVQVEVTRAHLLWCGARSQRFLPSGVVSATRGTATELAVVAVPRG